MSTRSLAVLMYDAAAEHGRADARDVLTEAQAVSEALEALGYAVDRLPVTLDLAAVERALARRRPALVFNLVESLEGRARLIHVVPGLLESLRVPFTGCGSATQYVTSHKVLAKRHLEAAGLPTPPLLGPADARAGPWIVKSVWEHASLGLDAESVASSGEDVSRLVARRRAAFGGEWFAEAYVDGRELNVAVIESPRGPRVLPVAEIRFDDFPQDAPRIVGYAAKWQPDSAEYRGTVRDFPCDPPLAERAGDIALACWRLFSARGYARVDLRVDAQGTPWVLELNANPCLSPDAGFAAALARAGVSFTQAIEWVVADALRGQTLPRG